MNRRTLAAAIAAFTLTSSALAAVGPRAQTPDAEVLPLVERRLELRALFERAPGVVVEDANGITVGPFQVDVIVARIDDDGSLVKACVDSEEAARRFLEAPLDKVEDRREKEH